MMRHIVLVLFAIGIVSGAGWYFISHRQFDWAVIVVAGDWHAHDGSESEAFDNARRDIAAEFAAIGFKAGDIAQFSVRPERYPNAHAFPSDMQNIASVLDDLSHRTAAGCLLYLTSHGTYMGMVLGDTTLEPEDLSRIVNETCGDRPAVIIVSACFSGKFVPALAAPNRMVMSAARADRSSFGCGQGDVYTYFDTCILTNLKAAHGFPELADRVRACVSKHEDETGMYPPSEPQVFIGPQAKAALPIWK